MPTLGVIDVDRHRVSKRIFRVLFASATVAAAWLAIDLVTHADSASAAEPIDVPVLPVGGPELAPVLDTVFEAIAPVATEAVPVIESFGAPLEALVEPLAPIVDPLETVLAEVVSPVTDAVAPLAPILAVVDTAVPALESVAPDLAVPLGSSLLAGGGLLLGAALASTLAPVLPAPRRGLPAPPVEPALPGGPSAFAPELLGELTSGVPTSIGALRASAPPTSGLPISPTFESDTTPD